MNNFQKRINYQGDLEPFLKQVCRDFNLGKYCSYKIIPIGYEDLNLMTTTNKGDFFAKVFGSFRDADECQRYVDIMEHALKIGVSHPKLYKSNQGFLYQISENESLDRLCVMEFIKGKIFYQLHATPSTEEMKFIINQAALINKMNFKPPLVYDHWSITNFLEEYKEKNDYLFQEDKVLIDSLAKTFNFLSIENLPHCFVHGDITKTNTMKSSDGRIYILDFAVANYYPRIQELAVLLCDLFFNPENLGGFIETYNFVLNEYQKNIILTSDEISKLPKYVKLAHAMHVLLASYEKIVKGNKTAENQYFLKIGREGLRFTNKIWKE